MMPQYFFKGPDGPDSDPIELADDHAAWSEAVRWCGEMLRDADGQLPPESDWSISVEDESRTRIITIKISARRLAGTH